MEFLVLVGLVLLNGLFAMSEIALVTARKARLSATCRRRRPRRLRRHGAGREPDPVPVHDPDRHHRDRHPQRDHRRSGLRGALCHVDPDVRPGPPHGGDRRHGARGRRHHVLHDRRRRARAQASRPAESGGDCARRGAPDAVACRAHAAVRQAPHLLHRLAAEALPDAGRATPRPSPRRRSTRCSRRARSPA